MFKFNPKTTGAALSALVLLIAAHSGAAEARDRGANAGAAGGGHAARGMPDRQRPNPGGTWTRTSERQRTDSGATRHDEWRNANGKTASRDVTVTRDREAGTAQRDATWTGPNGGTGSSHTDVQRTDTGMTRNTTVTNANGQTATRNVEVTRDKEAGTTTRNVDYTTFNGRSGSVVKACDKAAKSCTTTVEQNGGANPGN